MVLTAAMSQAGEWDDSDPYLDAMEGSQSLYAGKTGEPREFFQQNLFTSRIKASVLPRRWRSMTTARLRTAEKAQSETRFRHCNSCHPAHLPCAGVPQCGARPGKGPDRRCSLVEHCKHDNSIPV